jgi:hypothetical protein
MFIFKWEIRHIKRSPKNIVIKATHRNNINQLTPPQTTADSRRGKQRIHYILNYLTGLQTQAHSSRGQQRIKYFMKSPSSQHGRVSMTSTSGYINQVFILFYIKLDSIKLSNISA